LLGLLIGRGAVAANAAVVVVVVVAMTPVLVKHLRVVVIKNQSCGVSNDDF
jgi:hypothetical protein